MKFRNTIAKIERIRFYVMLFIVGVFFVVVSVIAISLPKAELLNAEGVIERIEPYFDSDGEQRQQVYVSYTDDSGVRHEDVAYPAYSSGMKVGDTVGVLFDPASPEDIRSPGGRFIPYIFIVIGVGCVAFSVIKIAAGRKKTESYSPFDNSTPEVDPALAEQVMGDDSEARDYYFHWTGRMNQSYVLETHSREPVYEAICDHIGILTPYRFTFANRKTGRTRECKVTHTSTSRYGGEVLSTVSGSHFMIDGVENWEYLGKLGYTVVPKRSGIRLNFDVLHHGVPVAYLEVAGTNILKDGAKNPLGDKLPAPGLYKVSCRDSDLEGVFLACFCVSRVEFY